MKTDMTTIEHSKENIVPSPSGHSASSLSYALTNTNFQTELEQFLQILNNPSLEEEEDDPLKYYHSYLQFLNAHRCGSGLLFGAGSSSGSGQASQGMCRVEMWQDALNWISRKFLGDPRYLQDNRFVQVWCWYAECCRVPEEVYRFMEQHGIGISTAMYYERFAEYLGVQCKRLEEAVNVFKLGIQRQARPLQRLERRMEAFVSAMGLQSPRTEIVRPKAVHLALKSGISSSAGTSSIQPRQEPTFSIFQDPEPTTNFPAKTLPYLMASTDDQKHKENISVANSWKGAKIPQHGLDKTISVPISVYKDRKNRVSFDRSLLMKDGREEELSFEEARATAVTMATLKETENIIVQDPCPKEILTVKPLEFVDLSEPKKTPVVNFPSPTVNTKLALADILTMFDEPIGVTDEIKDNSATESDSIESDKVNDFDNLKADDILKGDKPINDKSNNSTYLKTEKSNNNLDSHKSSSFQTPRISLKRHFSFSSPNLATTPRSSLKLTVNLSTKKVCPEPEFVQRLLAEIYNPEIPVRNDPLVHWSVSVIDSFGKQLLPFILKEDHVTKHDYHSLPHFDAIQKHFKHYTESKLVKVTDNVEIQFKRKIGEGGYASVFLANVVTFRPRFVNERTCVLKFQNPPCAWEYHILKKLQGKGSCIPVVECFGIFLFHNQTAIMLEPLSHGSLLDVINIYRKKKQIIPENIVAYYALGLLRILYYLVSNQIVHGDIKPENILLRIDSSIALPNVVNLMVDEALIDSWYSRHIPVLIDFGRSIDLSLFSHESRFKVHFEEPLSQGSLEALITSFQREHSSHWRYQIDTLGIANCVHVLLCNEYLSPVYNNKTLSANGFSQKRYMKYPWESLMNWLLNHDVKDIESVRIKLIEWSDKVNDQCFSKMTWRHGLKKHEALILDGLE